MAEVLVELMQSVTDDEGRAYGVLACGEPTDIGTWHGWLEFVSTDGTRLRSPRETTQPNRADTVYWATGLTPTYVEGSFERALTTAGRPAKPSGQREPAPPRHGRRESTVRSRRSESSDAAAAVRGHAVLNPFVVYARGEGLLRRQLDALSTWHLVNIVTAYGLSDLSETVLNGLPGTVLIDLIVDAVAAEPRPGP